MFLRSTSFSFQRPLCLAPDGPAGSGGSSTGSAGAGPSGPSGDSLASFRGSEPSAGTGSQASQPTPAAPSGGSDAPHDASYDFLNEVFDSPQATPSTSAAPTVAPATPGTAQPQAQPAQPAPQQAPQAPEVQTAQPQVPAQAQPGPTAQQPPSSPQFDPADPVSLARGLVENYDAAVTHLAQGVFAMSPQELEALETNVGGEVPRLLAKTVVYMQTQMLTQLGRIIPQMLQRHGEVQTRHTKNVDAFYQAWPSIDRTKHDQKVREIAQTFRQLNPDVPTEKMIETIGPFVLMQLGLPLVAMARGAAPGAPATTAARANGSRPTHFTPAAPGAVTVHQSPVEDPFGFLGAQEGG